MDVTKAINDIKAGKIEYRLDKANIIHVPIGKASFTEEQLADNFQIGCLISTFATNEHLLNLFCLYCSKESLPVKRQGGT